MLTYWELYGIIVMLKVLAACWSPTTKVYNDNTEEPKPDPIKLGLAIVALFVLPAIISLVALSGVNKILATILSN